MRAHPQACDRGDVHFGQPGVPLPRESLAEWSGGRADDFSADDWSWMGAAAAPEVAPARRPAKKKRR